MQDDHAIGLRERRRARTRRSIQEHAMRLFLERGYDATTVSDVAAAAEVSHMTVFRYFPTKEALVLADDYDPLLVERISARPAGEPLLRRLQAGLIQPSPLALAPAGNCRLTAHRFTLPRP